MNQPLALAAVAIGGAIGSVLRFTVSNLFLQRFGPGFPWGTFTINITGAFAIGVVLQLAQTRFGLDPYARLFVATGILGGYTTFSTFAYDAFVLGSSGLRWESVAYGLGSVIVGIAAAYLGVVLMRSLA